jgi:hypothetical protein
MIAVLREYAKRQMAKQGYSLKRINELTRLADLYGSDKGLRLSGHLYTRIYEKLFAKMRYEKISFLEMGLHRSDSDRRRAQCAMEGKSSFSAMRAPSLEMWRAYFPNARLFGFDIDDFSAVRLKECKITQGDMSSRDDLSRMLEMVKDDLDVIIDDASHASHHQQIALAYLWPHVRPGGLYIIEDMHWQDDRLERPNAPKTRELLRKFQVTGLFDSPYASRDENKFMSKNVSSVSLYDSLTLDVPEASDALAIIQKTGQPSDR